jgi:serine protease Do
MAGTKPLNFRRSALALATAAVFTFPLAAQAQRGPDRIADVAEAVIDAVVNISTSQTVAAGGSSPRAGTGLWPRP